MPEQIDAPPPPVQDLGKTPTLLETLSQQMDLSNAPQIKAKELPRIAEDQESTTKKPKQEKKAEKPPEEKAPEKPEKPEKTEAKAEEKPNLEEEWKKANETVAERMFRPRSPKKEEKKEEKKEPEKPVETKADEEKPPVKPEERKPTRKRASEAEITERAASAAAEAVTRAVSKMAPQPEKKADLPKPEDNLTPAERKQFSVYQELESSQPDRYKGVTAKYLKSLDAIQEYVKTWAKENPGQKFNPDAEDHNEFFARVEPEVDEDDWVDAKANLRARDISSQAIKPITDKLQAMEQERARTLLEPAIQQKTLEGVHMLLNEFDPEIAAEIGKPDGVKALQEKDPITSGILNHTAGIMMSLAAEVVRLHDPNAGVQFDPRNPAHKEIADFILSQEERIAKLPANDRIRDGKRFIGRLAYRQLQPDEKAGYWFLDQDDITYLLAQKYAIQAKRIRDAEIEKFNRTAETLGYKKIEGAKGEAKTGSAKAAQPAKPKETPASPEAVSRTSLKTATGTEVKPQPGHAEVILGNLFARLRS